MHNTCLKMRMHEWDLEGSSNSMAHVNNDNIFFFLVSANSLTTRKNGEDRGNWKGLGGIVCVCVKGREISVGVSWLEN